MTEGIIQNIITEYINMETNSKKKGFGSMFESNEELLAKLQQELIAEIKKEKIDWHLLQCKKCGNAVEFDVTVNITSELIGDF